MLVYLVPQAIFDIKNKAVFVIPNIIIAVLANLFILNDSLLMHSLAVVPGLILIVISLTIRDSIGPGDGLIVISIGSIMGLDNVIGILFISSVAAALFSAVLMIFYNSDRKKQVPFVPFLVVGVLICGII